MSRLEMTMPMYRTGTSTEAMVLGECCRVDVSCARRFATDPGTDTKKALSPGRITGSG